MFQLWLDKNIFNKQSIVIVESRISSFNVPSKFGTLPAHISSNYRSFTAKQWKNLILIYSPIVLKGVFSPVHMGCWFLFVQASPLICLPILTSNNISVHSFLSTFPNVLNNCMENTHLPLTSICICI